MKKERQTERGLFTMHSKQCTGASCSVDKGLKGNTFKSVNPNISKGDESRLGC